MMSVTSFLSSGSSLPSEVRASASVVGVGTALTCLLNAAQRAFALAANCSLLRRLLPPPQPPRRIAPERKSTTAAVVFRLRVISLLRARGLYGLSARS